MTGATGYIGSRLVPELVGRGHDVVAAVRRDGAADPGEVFMRRHGFEVAQEDRRNDLDVTAWVRGGVHTSTPGYVIETSTDDTLDEWLEDRAHLQRRMSTDAPMGGLVMVADPWDAERIREHDDRIASSGREIVTAAVEHVRSGTLAGFTEIIASACAPSRAIAAKAGALPAAIIRSTIQSAPASNEISTTRGVAAGACEVAGSVAQASDTTTASVTIALNCMCWRC